LLSIKRRGRWRSDASLRRYEKGPQATRLLAQLPAATRGFCIEAARLMPAVICGRAAPLKFRGC